MQTIPLHDYIAFNNPNGAVKAMEKFGYQIHARNKTALASTIAQFISREKEKGLKALALVHPDRDLILDYAGTKMGADGVLDTPGKEIKLPAAPETPLPITNSLQTNLNAVIIAGTFALSAIVLAIIAKK